MKPKNKRMFSGKREYHKFDIAVGYLETAIRLFLQDGCDMFSALHLAGAAGELLHGVVIKSGRKPFIYDVVNMTDILNPGHTPKRNAVITHIHNVLSINEIKHFDPGDPEIVNMDAEENALAAILKAIVDFKTLTGKFSPAMNAFMSWCYVNLDSAEIMESYNKAVEGEPKLKKWRNDEK